MKKLKNKIIYIIPLFIIILPLKVNAKTYTLSDNCSGGERTKDTDGITYKYKSYDGSIQKAYIIKYGNYICSSNTELYCLDPLLTNPSNIKESRDLNPYKGDEYPYDAAILYVLKSSYSNVVKETVLRMINAAWNKQVMNYTSGYAYGGMECSPKSMLNAYTKTAATYLTDQTKTNWLKALSKNTSKTQSFELKYLTGKCEMNSGDNFWNGKTSTIYSAELSDNTAIKTLFEKAIEAAADSVDKVTQIPENIISKKSDGKMRVNSGRLSRTVTLKVANLKSGFIKITNVEITQDKDKVQLSYDFKLNENIKGKEINLTFESNDDVTNNKISYKINYEYCPDSECQVGKMYVSTNNADTQQKLVAIINGEYSNFTGAATFGLEFKRPCETTMSISNNCADSTTGKIETKNDYLCYTSNNDDAGNTYKVNTSKYEMFKVDGCANIYCKEDYSLDFMPTYNPSTNQTDDKFIYTTSGRYFKLEAKINDKITCYADIKANKCKDMANTVILKYIAKHEFTAFNFLKKDNVELQYKYEDNYYTNGKDFADASYTNMNKIVDIDSMSVGLCDDNDSDDKCTVVNSTDEGLTGINLIFNNRVSNMMVGADNSKYIKLTINATATYTSKNQYQNYYTSGNVYKANLTNKVKTEENLIKEWDGLPIKIDTDKGLYNYQFKITNLGDYFDTGKSGRLIGNSNSVYKKLYSTNKTTFDGEYMCYYFVNCPDCEPSCENGTCKWNPNCPTCNDECVNCLYNGNKLKVTFRQITTENLNPNERTQGYNWNTDSPSFYKKTEWNFTNLKARATEAEIESSGTKIEQETPILKVDMTYDMAKYIKNNTSKSYSDDTLVCYDYEENGETKYENLFCYSTVLDDLENKYNDNITFINTRAKSIDTGSGKRTNKNATASGYWTLFDSESKLFKEDKNKNYVTATTFDFSSANHIGGPSWK